MYWADPVTGCSANFWLRAMGWFLVAMVDVLERMDDMLYYEYRAIMSMLKDAVDAMIAFQDAESGMFWQVIDKAGVEGNYLETSGSALFAYAVLKGCAPWLPAQAVRRLRRRRPTAPATIISAWALMVPCSLAASVW